MRIVRLTAIFATIGATTWLVFAALPRSVTPLPSAVLAHPCLDDPSFWDTSESINRQFQADWEAVDLPPAAQADFGAVRRRLSLALAGTLPSLEEWQRFEAAVPSADGLLADGQDDSASDSRQVALHQWIDYLLHDRRSADYLAERFARAFVGTENGPFLVFRRRRFVTWLSDWFYANRPYDELARQLITETGLRTDHPAVNFVTVTVDQNGTDQPDPIRLAARTTRALLSVRLDCVQCHDDHLYGQWLQSDFHQLAAFYSDCRLDVTGIHDRSHPYSVQYLGAETPEEVEPRVPFAERLLPVDGTRRQQLAAWVTHPDNRAFSRTVVNRLWAVLFGKPLIEPIDDIPLDGPYPAGLELLADDFAAHGFDLQRLIHLIASLDPFQLDSRADHPLTEQHEQHWAVFPVTRLRPEQVIGATIQASSLNTIDAQSHILVRLASFAQQQDFLKRYGDPGEEEFTGRGGTIPQRLLMMNGQVVHERTEENLVSNAATRIAALSDSPARALEVAYRCVLSRSPTPDESAYFLSTWQQRPSLTPRQHLEDLYWVLLNSTEFSWNH